MKIKYSVCFFFIFLSHTTFSQEAQSDKARLLSLSAGPALPKGDLDAPNSYVTTGLDIGLHYIARTNHNFGWAFQLRRVANPWDKDEIIEKHLYGVREGANITGGSFTRWGLLTGPQLLFPLSSTFYLHFGAYGGLVQDVYPELTITSDEPFYSSYYVKQKRVTALAFAFGGQGFLRKEFTNGMFITAGMDYFFSEAHFKELIVEIKNVNGDISTMTSDLKVGLPALSVLAGVGLNLSKQ